MIRKIEKYYDGSRKLNTPSENHKNNFVIPVSGTYDSMK